MCESFKKTKEKQEMAKTQEFIAFIYDKYGNDPETKVLSTQDLHYELLSWIEREKVEPRQLQSEIDQLKNCIKDIKQVLKMSTFNRSLYGIEQRIEELGEDNEHKAKMAKSNERKEERT